MKVIEEEILKKGKYKEMPKRVQEGREENTWKIEKDWKRNGKIDTERKGRQNQRMEKRNTN